MSAYRIFLLKYQYIPYYFVMVAGLLKDFLVLFIIYLLCGTGIALFMSLFVFLSFYQLSHEHSLKFTALFNNLSAHTRKKNGFMHHARTLPRKGKKT